MEKYDFFESVKGNENPNTVTFGAFKPGNALVDSALAKQITKQNTKFCRRWLEVAEITDIKEVPANVLASYLYNPTVPVRQNRIIKGCIVVYSKASYDYVDITDSSAATSIAEAAISNAGKSPEYLFLNGPVTRNNRIVWSENIRAAYNKKYNEEILDKLIYLFKDGGEAARFRSRYYSLLTELVETEFLAVIKNICTNYGIKFAGQFTSGEGLLGQILPTCFVMPYYTYFDYPLVSCACPSVLPAERMKRVRSVAAQAGVSAAAAISSFSEKGVGLATLKNWADSLAFLGISNFLFADESSAELGGVSESPKTAAKKRALFSEYASKFCAAVAEGTDLTDTLLLVPVYGAYAAFNPTDVSALSELDGRFNNIVAQLDAHCIAYHYADERMLSNAVIENGNIVFNNKRYSKIVVPPCMNISRAAAAVIINMAASGGFAYFVGERPTLVDGATGHTANELSKVLKPLENIALLRPEFDITPGVNDVGVRSFRLPDGSILCFAYNAASVKRNVTFTFRAGAIISEIDFVTNNESELVLEARAGKLSGKCSFTCNFEGFGVKCLHISRNGVDKQKIKNYKYIEIEPQFDLDSITDNALRIDKCEYRLAGGRWQPALGVDEIEEKLAASHGNGLILCYKFNMAFEGTTPKIFMGLNNPDNYRITVNNVAVSSDFAGKYFESGYKTTEISSLVQQGINQIELTVTDAAAILAGGGHPAENLLILGKFAVSEPEFYERIEHGAYLADGFFTVTDLPKTVTLNRIAENGFWFFCGEMQVSAEIPAGERQAYSKFGIRRLNCAAADIFVNGKYVSTVGLGAPEADISDYITEKSAKITLKLYSDYSNLFAQKQESGKLKFMPFGANLREYASSFIGFDNVSKFYKTGVHKIAAVDQMSFGIDRGEFVVIVGPSGAGKTTLLNILGGMDTASEGRIIVDGNEINEYTEKELTDFRRYDVGFVFQNYNLVGNLTALENVELASQICNNPYDPKKTLAAVGLSDRADHFASQLSGGEQQRVSIARALAKNPKLLLCDEPTGALDYVTGKAILRLLYDTCKQTGKTVIVITHNNAICGMADRVIKIKNGHVTDNTVKPEPIPAERIEW